MKEPKYPMVLVYATDWSTYNGTYGAHVKFEPTPQWVMGFLLEKGDNLSVAQELTDEVPQQVAHVVVIPKEAVIELQYLSAFPPPEKAKTK